MVGIAASVVAAPAGVSLAAANQSYGLAIESIQPTRGQVVGVAHPVVVTFSAPVARTTLSDEDACRKMLARVEASALSSGGISATVNELWLENWIAERMRKTPPGERSGETRLS